MIEDEMLELLVAYVYEEKVHVPCPDYRIKNCYPPQWKCIGNLYYYQLPRKGKIIAKFYHLNGKAEYCEFESDGFDLR